MPTARMNDRLTTSPARLSVNNDPPANYTWNFNFPCRETDRLSILTQRWNGAIAFVSGSDSHESRPIRLSVSKSSASPLFWELGPLGVSSRKPEVVRQRLSLEWERVDTAERSRMRGWVHCSRANKNWSRITTKDIQLLVRRRGRHVSVPEILPIEKTKFPHTLRNRKQRLGFPKRSRQDWTHFARWERGEEPKLKNQMVQKLGRF